MMARMVLSSVFWRWRRASMNHLAESIFCFTKLAASFSAFESDKRPFSMISEYFRLMRSSGMEKRGMVRMNWPFS